MAGCAFLSNRQFTYTFPAQADLGGPRAVAALPVVLTDRTGVVVALEEAPAAVSTTSDQGVVIDPTLPNAVILYWPSGPCDTGVTIDATPADASQPSPKVDIVVTTHFRDGPCEQVRMQRQVLIKLSGPADPTRIGVRFTFEVGGTGG